MTDDIKKKIREMAEKQYPKSDFTALHLHSAYQKAYTAGAEALEKLIESKLNKAYKFILAHSRSSGIGGRALTNYTCFRCEKEYCHANTATPIFCSVCVKMIRS